MAKEVKAKFRRGSYEILAGNINGKWQTETVDGWVYGIMGIRRAHKRGFWQLTYIPSGMMMGTGYFTLREARAAAVEYAPFFPKIGEFGKVPREVVERIRDHMIAKQAAG